MKLPLLFLSLVLSLSSLPAPAQEAVNWPVEPAPAGINPAVFPSCRNDWMVKFQGSLTRAKAGPVDLLFEGDSITERWKLQAALMEQRYHGRNAAVFGQAGDRTENLLWRLAHGEMDGLSPKLIVLLIGTNNLGRDKPPEIAEGVAAVVKMEQEKCPQSHILLLGVFPRGPQADYPMRAQIKEINTRIAKLDDGERVTFLDFGAKFLDANGAIPKSMMDDFLHPLDPGYVIWADAIQPYVDKYVPAKS